MTQIILKVRDLIQDNLTPIPNDVQTYLGGAKIFNLLYASIDSSTLVVLKNGSTWATSNYSYSSTTGKVTVTGTLATGDVLTFQYSAYLKYSDSELRGYIRSALYYLSSGKYKTFVARSDNTLYPTATEAEECLIAIISALLIKGNVKSYRTPEFSIVFDTDNMSIDKKISMTIKKYKKTFGYVGYIDLREESESADEDING